MTPIKIVPKTPATRPAPPTTIKSFSLLSPEPTKLNMLLIVCLLELKKDLSVCSSSAASTGVDVSSSSIGIVSAGRRFSDAVGGDDLRSESSLS